MQMFFINKMDSKFCIKKKNINFTIKTGSDDPLAKQKQKMTEKQQYSQIDVYLLMYFSLFFCVLLNCTWKKQQSKIE
jgi:hypothetical protein